MIKRVTGHTCHTFSLLFSCWKRAASFSHHYHHHSSRVNTTTQEEEEDEIRQNLNAHNMKPPSSSLAHCNCTNIHCSDHLLHRAPVIKECRKTHNEEVDHNKRTAKQTIESEKTRQYITCTTQKGAQKGLQWWWSVVTQWKQHQHQQQWSYLFIMRLTTRRVSFLSLSRPRRVHSQSVTMRQVRHMKAYSFPFPSSSFPSSLFSPF